MEDHVVEPQHARAVSSGLGGSGGNTRIPEWSAPKLSSAAEQIIPSELRP